MDLDFALEFDLDDSAFLSIKSWMIPCRASFRRVISNTSLGWMVLRLAWREKDSKSIATFSVKFPQN